MQQWQGKTDGNRWMQQQLIFWFRFLNLRIYYAGVGVVALFYMLLGKGFRPSYRFYRQRMGMSSLRAWWWSYKNHVRFGQVMIDRFARYAGLNTTAIIAYSQLIGGFIAGVGGSVEILGMYDRFQWQSLPGYGFDGIVVAILAKNKPHYIPIAAFFLAYLKIGADKMATSTDVTAEMVSIIQGVIIMLAAAQAFLSKWRQKALIKMQQESGLDG